MNPVRRQHQSINSEYIALHWDHVGVSWAETVSDWLPCSALKRLRSAADGADRVGCRDSCAQIPDNLWALTTQINFFKNSIMCET